MILLQMIAIARAESERVQMNYLCMPECIFRGSQIRFQSFKIEGMQSLHFVLSYFFYYLFFFFTNLWSLTKFSLQIFIKQNVSLLIKFVYVCMFVFLRALVKLQNQNICRSNSFRSYPKQLQSVAGFTEQSLAG